MLSFLKAADRGETVFGHLNKGLTIQVKLVPFSNCIDLAQQTDRSNPETKWFSKTSKNFKTVGKTQNIQFSKKQERVKNILTSLLKEGKNDEELYYSGYDTQG